MPPRNADKSDNPKKAAPRTTPRRVGNESSATRALILDTTERLMIDEGYAAVTTRRVATEIDIKAPLVHYYFPTTDDLFLAVYRRAAEKFYLRLDETLANERPLHALWAFACDSSRTTLAVEFMALANHRKVIGKELTIYVERARQRQAEVVQKLLQDAAVDIDCPPLALSVLMAGVGRALVMEGGIGITLGHDAARLCVAQWLDRIEPPPATKRSPRRPRS